MSILPRTSGKNNQNRDDSKILVQFTVLYFVKILSAALVLHAGRRADILIDLL